MMPSVGSQCLATQVMELQGQVVDCCNPNLSSTLQDHETRLSNLELHDVFQSPSPPPTPNIKPMRWSFSASTLGLHPPMSGRSDTEETIINCDNNVTSLTQNDGWNSSTSNFSQWACNAGGNGNVNPSNDPFISWYEDDSPTSWIEYTVPAGGYTNAYVRCCGRSGCECGIELNGTKVATQGALQMGTSTISVTAGDTIRMKEYKNGSPTPHEIVYTSFVHIE